MATIGYAIATLLWFVGVSFVLCILFAYLIARHSKSHLQVFYFTVNYLVIYWFISIELNISYLYLELFDLLPSLLMLPVAHAIYYLRTRKKRLNLMVK